MIAANITWVMMVFVLGQEPQTLGIHKHESMCIQQANQVARQNENVRGPQRYYGCTPVHGFTR